MKNFIQQREEGFRQFASYFVIGLGATAVDMGLLYIFKEFVGWSLLVANIGSFSGAVVFNFLLQRKYTFKNKSNKQASQFLMFMTLALIGLVLNSAILLFLSEKMGLWYMWSKTVATGVVFLWNFGANKWITFREN